MPLVIRTTSSLTCSAIIASVCRLDELAREVGCSRSVLAERFTHFLGLPPIQYLTSWRLARAASLLRAGTARLVRVAQEVGYDSEAAFNRAYSCALVSPARADVVPQVG